MSEIDWQQLRAYVPQRRLRFVTATALFDGHDASINIFRRLLQQRGAEVIHLGHDRAAAEIAQAAHCEDVHGIAVSSYQGGHNEFFVYLRQLLDARGGEHIKIFGGGGGVITPKEIAALQRQGISKIFSPEDGQVAGLDGIIGYMLQVSDAELAAHTDASLPRALTLLEAQHPMPPARQPRRQAPVLGVTGSGGAGKSSLIDEILLRLLADFKDCRIAVICIDPTKSKTGGALLGDRLRLNCARDERVFVRSFATRRGHSELTSFLQEALHLLQAQDFDLIVVETSGIGQANSDIVKVADRSLYVMTPEYGAPSQLEKIDMLDYADFIAINKFERPQALDAIRDVCTQLRRSRFGGQRRQARDYPVFGVIASRFNDDGVSGLYRHICATLFPTRDESKHDQRPRAQQSSQRAPLLPATRQQYLFDIAAAVRRYHRDSDQLCALLREREGLRTAHRDPTLSEATRAELQQAIAAREAQLPAPVHESIAAWRKLDADYDEETTSFVVRGKEITAVPHFVSLTENKLPKVARPRYDNEADLLRYLRKENLPGSFPYTAGIMPFRRTQEDPQRQFAGEGSPEQTNKRFHYLSASSPAKRLSTAFDSVTLYGHDPDARPDIYGKVGESGVSVATLDDMQKLYAGFDLCAPQTSVSMTINGPAPIILAMYLNTAIAQQLDKQRAEGGEQLSAAEQQTVIAQTLQTVRGTVQADILKEDQAQNTCIFSTEFALRMMGDVQEYFVKQNIKRYYSVSISGFHIAEAGANPVTQLALTLANGFTYLEYYLARGMHVDDFAPNLSFFFSSGLDPEYSVLGRVARRIWALALRDVYNAAEDSCKLKYHVQTSGRSLHAQEMTFNDIRTTLQALMALCENCNSLHTNAFDEALTTPTEESVRQAMAIQLIINRELGLNQCENVLQGSYFIEYLTDLVEEQVLQEFERLAARGGVLGAMEAQYQRGKIQEQSLYYEELKHAGAVPIVGVNTFLADRPDQQPRPKTNLIRATPATKDQRLADLAAFKQRNAKQAKVALQKLQQVVLKGDNIFAELMHTVKHATLQEITQLLFTLGGRYRRLM